MMTRVSRRWLLVAVEALGAFAAGTAVSLLFSSDNGTPPNRGAQVHARRRRDSRCPGQGEGRPRLVGRLPSCARDLRPFAAVALKRTYHVLH